MTPSKTVAIALIAAMASPAAASADEIRIIGTGAVKHTIEALAARFTADTGHTITASFATAGVVTQRGDGGEMHDVVMSSDASLRTLAGKSRVSGTPATLGTVRIAVAVRAGAPAPAVDTPEALRAALLSAPVVSYGDPKAGATTGIHFAKVLDQLGIRATVDANANLQKDGLDVMREVAAGRAVLGITQASEVNAIPGVTLAGFLPASLQLVSTYQAALTPSGQGKAPAAAFVAFVTGPSGAAAFRAAGFETP